jgi:putative membrane protein
MTTLWLILHFGGLVIAFSATFANMVTMRLIASATPQEAAVLSRVPLQMLRLSSWGVVILLITGPLLVYSKYDGEWGTLPVAFWLKMPALAVLVVIYGFLHVNMARARKGDATAEPRIQTLAPMASLVLSLVMIFAVFAFV